MKSDSARTEPEASVTLRYSVQPTGNAMSSAVKIMAGAARTHFRCLLAHWEKFSSGPVFRSAAMLTSHLFPAQPAAVNHTVVDVEATRGSAGRPMRTARHPSLLLVFQERLELLLRLSDGS